MIIIIIIVVTDWYCSHVSCRWVSDSRMLLCVVLIKELHMDGCHQVTDDAVEALTYFCPRISILIFHACPNITGTVWINSCEL